MSSPRPLNDSRSNDRDAAEVAAALDGRLMGLESLEERIAAAVRAVPGPIVFATSLGLEDQAVLHAIAHVGAAVNSAANGAVNIVTLDTGRHFPETLDTLDRSEQRYGLRIRVVAPDAAELEALVARDGVLGFRHSIDARKACCDVRKVRPLRRALAGAAAWITGLRRGQSAGRGEIAFASWDASEALIKVNPLADWSLERLDAYIRDNDIPVNALHARGFPSIGCQPCTRAIRPGEDIRAGRWWWESEDGKECGLHNRPARGREHPHLPRGCGAVPPSGAALFDRQGLDRPAPFGAQGVLSGQAALPPAACRYDLEVPRHDRVP
jgi:phosphoadenosine phosphosulfate reductase